MICVGLYNFARGVLKNDEFFGDTVDTPKEGIEQHRKRECIKSVIVSGKETVDKASDKTINKTCKQRELNAAFYKQCELNEKGEKTGKVLGKHVINLYSTGISRLIKIRDVKKLQQDIENDPIIKHQTAKLRCLSVYTFGNFLAPVLVAAHTVNKLDLGNKPEDEGYESD